MTLNANRLLLLVAAALFLIASLLGFGVFSSPTHLFGWVAAGLLATVAAQLV